MLRDAWFIAVNDLRFMLRSRETLVWTLLFPPMIFYVIGTIMAGGAFTGSGLELIAVRSEGEPGFLADQIVDRLEQQSYDVIEFDAEHGRLGANGEPLESSRDFDDYRLRLRIPYAFTDSVLAGEQARLTVHNDGDDLGASLDELRVTRSVYTVLADVLAASGVATSDEADLARLTAADIDAFRARERSLTLEVGAAGRRIPNGFEQSVPGITVMFTLLVLLTSGGTQLVIERRSGILRRLASAPIRRGAVVLGKWGGKLGLAVVQIGFALLIGRFALGVELGPQWPMLLLTLGAYAALIASLGILLGNLAATEAQAIGIGILSANVLAALGGCFWPIELTPGYMQQLALFVPTGWMMDAVHKLMIFGRAWNEALPHAIGMSAGAWLLGMLCARRFRFE